jgi:TonB family protein
MRLRTTIAAVAILVVGILASIPTFAQQAKAPRQVLTRISPRYPDLARPMRLEGTVRMTVIVAANGSVKSIDGTKGHPVLLKAAQDAISKWKWVPAPQESVELVELKFQPE